MLLSTIAHFEHTTAPLVIAHQEQFPAVTISFNLAPDASLSDAVKVISQAERDIDMPSSLVGTYSGDAAEFGKSLAGQPWLILAAAVTIYIVLGVLYESFIHPLTILSTLPSAGVGALLALMYFDMDLSVVALIGIVLLMGIVKKNAIMIIDFALDAERKQGLSPHEAIVQASFLRFRPIMMTTLAALFGAIPLAFERRHRLGAAQSARHHHHRRPAAQPDADALHHAGDLSRDGAAEGAVCPAGAAADRARSPGEPEPTQRTRRSDGMRCQTFSEPFIRRPVGTTLLAIGLLLVGAVAYRFLPVASMPTIEFPTISVTASRPGADPETMAATVAAPLERRLSEIPGVSELTSRSSLGSTRISVQFDLSRSIEGAARDVQAALNAAQIDLPGDLQSRPTFRKVNPAATPVMILALTSKTLPPSALYDAADTVIAQRLSQVDGVAEVSVNGAEQPAIRIRVNPVALAAMGLDMENVRTAVANTNAAGAARGVRRRRARRDHRRQRSAPHGARIRSDRGAHRQRHGGAALGRRVRRGERAQQPLRRLVQRPALGAAGDHQAGEFQRHRDRRSDLRNAAGTQALDLRPASTFRCCPTGPRPSGPASATCSSRCSRPSRW